MGSEIARSAAVLAAAYLAGNVSAGLTVAVRMGVDLRAVGSGNVGAANASRALGRRWGLAVLLGDALKGALAVLIARASGGGAGLQSAAALAAAAGHVWPALHRFRGGKGVATALGGFALLEPRAALVGAATWAVVAGHTRVAAIGSIVGVAIAALWAHLFAIERPHALLGAALLALVLVTHRANLLRLARGRENRL